MLRPPRAARSWPPTMTGDPGREDVCWVDLGEPKGSRPARRRPVLVIQANPYNASRLATTLVAVITSNTALATMPGNVFLPAVVSILPKDSVLNVNALVTIDKSDRTAGRLPARLHHGRERPRPAPRARL